MTLPGPPPRPNENVEQQIARLWEALRELSRKTLHSASIASGGLLVKDGGEVKVEVDDGVYMFYLGPLVSGGVPLRGIVLARENGQQMFANGVSGGDPNKVFFAWKDNAQNILFSDDAASGAGISRPWLSMPTVPVLSSSVPVTQSGTFVSTHSTGYVLKLQPNIELQALLLSTGTGVGEARFTLNGTQIGSTIAISSGDFNWTSPINLVSPVAFNSYQRIELQVRRTNAAGSVGGVLVATQRQT